MRMCTVDEERGTEDVLFRADCDGSCQRYVVVAPKKVAPGATRDVLLVLHGHGADRWQFVKDPRGECRACRDVAAERGMVLVSPDYRGDSWMGPTAEADILQIIRDLRAAFRVGRLYVAGGSMGGTAALTFTALHPEMVGGVVAMNAVANLLEFDSFPPGVEAMARSFGGTKEKLPEEYRRRSAELFPERFTMPLAVTTGGKDVVTPPDSVLRLARAVSERGGMVRVFHRKTAGHSTSYRDARAAVEFVIRMAEKGARRRG